MTKSFNRVLMLFRRDLRIFDNTALHHAMAVAKTVIPCFIFDPRQVGNSNKYRSNAAVQFMIESLKDLDAQLHQQKGRLYIVSGKAEEIVKRLIQQWHIEAVFFNKDYTPFSKKRDAALGKVAKKLNIQAFSFDDALLTVPDTILTSQNKPYTIFTPFYKKVRAHKIEQLSTPSYHWYNGNLPGTNRLSSMVKKLVPHWNQLIISGGRTAGKKILRHLVHFKHYARERDYPHIETTHLSAHLKFGTLSVREVFTAIKQQLGAQHPLLRQLYWRDFFTYIVYYFPHVLGHAFRKSYGKLRWRTSKKDFDAWCTGRTGFPLVDAGMRQLNATGFMHNRVRMVVASFLTKDLHIDWRKGECYFAQQLVDYDPAVNNGNWQWVASTGADAMPYFRIFNPWTQQKKFDAQCTYIKQWVPELRNVDNKIIHAWYNQKYMSIKDYPRPMVDHTQESKIAKMMYKKY